MSKILITGVDGFTGRHLTRALASHGHEIIGISHSPITDPVDGLSVSHVCDLTDQRGLKQIVAELRPQKVAHLAAIAFVSHGIVEDIYRTNVIGSRNLLDAISDVDCVDTVLIASSANIYGNRVSGAINEKIEPDPINDYAASKISMEFVANIYRDRIPIVISRPFNYTGLGQSKDFVIPKIIDHVQRGATQIELGNLDVARDFSDVRDVAAAYVALLFEKRSIGEVFNICSGQAHSLREVISLIKEISGHDFDVTVNPAFVRKNEVKILWGDRSKLDKISDQRPVYNLSDTLSWMLNK